MDIKFVVFDFDGVFTDGKFYFNNNKTCKSYNAKDSYALKLLNDHNIKTGIITNDSVVSIEYAKHIFDRLDKCSIGNTISKLDILDSWLIEFDLSYNNVAYIGDDLPDMTVLKKVGLSACPNDAVDEVKQVSQYICKNKGGEGAVREFVDLIIKNNISYLEKTDDEQSANNDGKITAVIPVRKGSTRCKNKNIRNFGDTNLLKLKIETLKKVKGIDRILVSSNCDIMLGIAKDLGVDIHKRDEQWCQTNTTGSQVFTDLAKNVNTQILLYTHCVAPFTSKNNYENGIKMFLNNPIGSLVSAKLLKEFILYNNMSINYDLNKAPPSQNLPDYFIPNFSFVIVNTKDVLLNKNIIVKPIKEFVMDSIVSTDIDYSSDFLISENLYKHDIVDENIANLIINKRNNDKIELLDCTIRDGGYLHNWDYSFEQIIDCYNSVTKAEYDYFEIGFKADKSIVKNKGRWYYSSEEDVKTITDLVDNGCKIAVLLKPGDINTDNIPLKSSSSIDLYRVLINRSTAKMDIDHSFYNNEAVKESCQICQELINKGYEVTINIGCFDNITDKEIILICSNVNKINEPKAIYLADTYGSGTVKNIPIQLHKLYTEFNKYKSNIPFGFHCHNNNENALSKTAIAIYHGCTMIDSCIGGLGRGAGNLKSEQLVSYLYTDNTEYIKKITPLIVYFDKHILSKTEYQQNHHIQSHPYYMISGILSLHPNYIHEILNMNTNVIEDINLIVKLYKYTKENNERNYNKNLINNLHS
jgi:YrbI family 3-deoxy-D-manno-octulosonate 8-phosphate phosphatase